MPTPDRTSLTAIVDAARNLLESDGLAGLTMNAVAERVGVRPPSLYKRVQNRDELVRLVSEATLTELTERLRGAPRAGDVANAVRTFAHERPAAFQLCIAPGPHTPPAAEEFWAAPNETLLRVAADLAGAGHALEAARTLTAWVVGFVSMELNGSFKLGGSVQEAWEFGVERITAAITAPAPPPVAEPTA